MEKITQSQVDFIVDVRDIHVDASRGRKSLEKLDELSQNIAKNGLIHPIVVTHAEAEGKYTLIAGERRLRASMLLGKVSVRCTLRDSITQLQAKEMELDENLQREALEWPEKIELMRQLDELKRSTQGSGVQGNEREGGWNLAKTAAVVGLSSGAVSQQLKLARVLRERPDIKDKVKGMTLHTAIRKAQQTLKREDIQRQQKSGLLKVSSSIRQGDARTLIKEIASESVDVIITDPPFGIQTIEDDRQSPRENYAKEGGKKVAAYTAALTQSDNSTLEEVTRLMFELMPELQRVLKPSGHIYVFFTFDFYMALFNTMKEFFSVNQTPIIWWKQRTTSPGMGYDYSPCYEPVLFGHKAPRKKKLAKDASLVQVVKPLAPKLKLHPFEKPQELLKFFITQSTYKGDVVLDPFVGSGATVRAARSLGRTGIGFEVDESHFADAQGSLVSELK